MVGCQGVKGASGRRQVWGVMSGRWGMPVLSRLHLQGPWEVSGWALYRDGADGVAGPGTRAAAPRAGREPRAARRWRGAETGVGPRQGVRALSASLCAPCQALWAPTSASQPRLCGRPPVCVLDCAYPCECVPVCVRACQGWWLCVRLPVAAGRGSCCVLVCQRCCVGVSLWVPASLDQRVSVSARTPEVFVCFLTMVFSENVLTSVRS